MPRACAGMAAAQPLDAQTPPLHQQRCPAGTFADQTGSSSCTDCGAGTFSPRNATSCTLCAAGSFSGQRAATCTVSGGACACWQ